jgi:FMN-dependent NADH-azoreductase
VVTARGGRYSGTSLDFQEPYVRQLLGFIGITDVEFVNVEGQALGPEEAAKGRAEAEAALAALA